MPRRNEIEILIKAVDQASNVITGIQKSVTSSFSSISKDLLKTGTLLTAASGPFVTGLAASVKTAANFEDAMKNVQSILGDSNDEMAALNKEILNIAKDSRAGPQAVSEAFYDIVSAVSDTSTHMAILDAAIKTSEAGQADLRSTTAALIGVMNAYSLTANDAAHISDIFTTAVKNGVLTMDDLASALPQITPMASALNIQFEEVAAALAYITKTGTSAAQGATQLRAAMTSLINPNESLKKVFEELGVANGQALIDNLGLVGALQAVAQSGIATQEGLAKVLGSTEALNAALVLTEGSTNDVTIALDEYGDAATEVARVISGAGDDADNLNTTMAETADTVADNASAIEKALADTGDTFNEAMAGATKPVQRFTEDMHVNVRNLVGAGDTMVEGLAGATERFGTSVRDPLIAATEDMERKVYNKKFASSMNMMGGDINEVAVQADEMRKSVVKAVKLNLEKDLKGAGKAFQGLSDEVKGFNTFYGDFRDHIEGATLEAWETQTSSMAAQMDILRSTITATSIEIGMVFLPELTNMTETIGRAVGGILDFVQANPLAVKVVGEFAAAVFGMGSALITAGLALKAIPIALALITNPLAWLTVGIAAFGVAYKENLFGFADAVDRVAESAKGQLERLSAAFENIGGFQGIFENIKDKFAGISLPEFSFDLPDIDLSQAKADIVAAFDNLQFPEISLPAFSFSMPDIDLSQAKTDIETSFGNLQIDPDFGNVAVHINRDLIEAVLAIATLMFGGPIGAGIGIAKLLVKAYETDFLGFATKLQESGVITEIGKGLRGIQDFATSLFTEAGGAGGGLGGVNPEESFIGKAVSFVVDGFQPIVDWLGDQWVTLKEGLVDLKEGVLGFFNAFEGTETSGFEKLVPVFEAVIAVIAGIVLKFSELGIEVISNMLSEIGNFLPVLGEGISALITTASRLLEGDFSGALTSFLDGVKNFAIGLAEVKLQSIIDFVDSIENLTGIDLSEVADSVKNVGEEVINGIKTAIINGLADITGIFTGTGEGTLAGAFTTALATATELINIGLDIGEKIAGGLLSAMSELPGKFIQALNDAIPNELNLGKFRVGPGGRIEIDLGSIDLPDNPIPVPGKALGGPVQAGKPYITGEKGFELFVPKASGEIVPHDQLMTAMAVLGAGGGGGDTYEISVMVDSSLLSNAEVVRNADVFADRLEERIRALR